MAQRSTCRGERAPIGHTPAAPGKRRVRRGPTVLTAFAGVVLAALALAGCGGSSGASGSGSNAPDAVSGKAAESALKFSKCMREHGVKNFPNPEITGDRVVMKIKNGGPGADPQTVEAAQKACRHFQEGLEPKLTPQEKVEREEAVQKFAKCMREHGINVHSETSGGNIRIGGDATPGAGHREFADGGLNPESPAFQAAQKACQGLLPFKGQGPPGTSQSGAAGKASPGASKGSGGQSNFGLAGG